MLTTVEKVIFLQDIDIFEFTSTEDLAHIAAITDEVPFQADEKIAEINKAYADLQNLQKEIVKTFV
ncbi:MAG: hypothetical protein MUP98_05180 [Candidatus Aminicenantes bacterium]|nr:hypothetical protein [Candidatus Aminicenantes bacterium]